MAKGDEQNSAAEQPTADAAREALEKLLANPALQITDRHRRFLRYVVEETLAGRSEAIKAYTIGAEVFGRGADFNADRDPIVRIEASRLRAALARYYQGPGRGDRIRISLPQGRYVPRFELVEAAEEGQPAQAGQPPRTRSGRLFALAKRGRRTGFALAGLVLLIGAAFLTAFLARPREGAPAPTVVVQPTLPETAQVLEVLNAHAFTQSLLTDLKRIPGLSVVSSEILDRNDSAVASVDTDGRAYVLSSAIFMGRGGLRVLWTLVDQTDGKVLLSESVEHNGDIGPDAGMIKDDMAQAITTRIGRYLGVVPAESAGSREPSTSDRCVLRARGYNDTFSESMHREIRSCLEEVVAAEPDNSDAWAMLSFIYLDEERNGYNLRSTKEDASERSLAAANRATLLAPNSDLAQYALMVILYRRGDFVGADRAARRGLEINPGNADLKMSFGIRLYFRGRFDESLRLTKEAIRAKAVVPSIYHVVPVLDYYRKGEYADALAEVELMKLSDFYPMHLFRAAILGEMGRQAEARQALEALLRLRPNYAAEMRADWNARHMIPELTDRLADGLRKAGLAVD